MLRVASRRRLERFETWLFAPEEARATNLAMAGIVAIMALRMATWPWRELAGLDKPLFRPVTFLVLLPATPPAWLIGAVQVAGLAACAAYLLRRHRRAAFAVAWAAFLILAGLRASRGKIQHNDVLVVIAAIPFLAAPLAREATMVVSGWARRSAAVVVAGSYFFAGLRKLTIVGPAWATGDTMRWIMYRGADSRRSVWPEAAFYIAERPWLAHLLACSLLTLELGFPFFFARERWRPVLAATVVVFHAGTWLTLGLDYWNYAALVVLLLPTFRFSRWRRWPRSAC